MQLSPSLLREQVAEVALAGHLVDEGWIQATTATMRSTAPPARAPQRVASQPRPRRSPVRRRPTATITTVAAPMSETTYTKLRWVCTSRLAMPTTNGAISRSPAASAHSMRSRHQNGSSMACGCQASNSSSLPMLQARPADSAVTSTMRPQRRRPGGRPTPRRTMAAMLAAIDRHGQADVGSGHPDERRQHVEPQRPRVVDGLPGGLRGRRPRAEQRVVRGADVLGPQQDEPVVADRPSSLGSAPAPWRRRRGDGDARRRDRHEPSATASARGLGSVSGSPSADGWNAASTGAQPAAAEQRDRGEQPEAVEPLEPDRPARVRERAGRCARRTRRPPR